MVVHIICNEVESFEGKLAEAQSAVGDRGVLAVLFTGAVAEETGKSWCPDCTAALPVIKAAIDKLEGACLLEVPITRSDFRKDDLFYKSSSKIKLQCVPTLVRWDTQNRLDDSQSQKPELVELLLSDE